MSRSRKNTPIAGLTTAASDKPYKTAEHRRERRAGKISVAAGEDPEPSKTFGNPWKGEKDGKTYLEQASAKDLRK